MLLDENLKFSYQLYYDALYFDDEEEQTTGVLYTLINKVRRLMQLPKIKSIITTYPYITDKRLFDEGKLDHYIKLIIRTIIQVYMHNDKGAAGPSEKEVLELYNAIIAETGQHLTHEPKATANDASCVVEEGDAGTGAKLTVPTDTNAQKKSEAGPSAMLVDEVTGENAQTRHSNHYLFKIVDDAEQTLEERDTDTFKR